MAKDKKTGMGGKSLLGGGVEKKSAVQSFASKPEEEPKEVKNPRKTFSSQMLPEVKQQLKLASATLGKKEYLVIEEALEAYFVKIGLKK